MQFFVQVQITTGDAQTAVQHGRMVVLLVVVAPTTNLGAKRFRPKAGRIDTGVG